MIKKQVKEGGVPDKTQDQDIDKLLASLQEKFGEGAIMKLGDMRRINVDSIPTGSFSLDIALGVNGLPKGRIIEIFGPESSGKCINRDSIVFSEVGMLPIGDFGSLVVPGFQKKEVFIHSENCFEKTSHFYNNGLKNTIKVKTHNGFSIDGTPNHRIRVIDKSGNYIFRQLDDLEDNDYIAIQRGQNCFGSGVDLSKFEYQKNKYNRSLKKFSSPSKVTKDLALLMGYLIGDGTTTKTRFNKNNIQLTAGDDETKKDFIDICQKLFNEKPKVTPDKRTKDTARLTIHNAHARSFLEYAGLGWHAAGTKEVPWTILCSPREIVSAFVSALYECDGCFSSNTIEYCTKSPKLAQQIQTILLNYGIVARKKTRFVSGKPYDYLYIDGQADQEIFYKEISFRSKRKNNLLGHHISRKRQPQTNTDVIPYQHCLLNDFFDQFNKLIRPTNRSDWKIVGDYLPASRSQKHCRLSYDRLNKILKHFCEGRNLPEYQKLEQFQELGFFFDKIQKIEKSKSHVVDFTVPKNATFFANGFVNHNTTLSLNVIAQSQKSGGKCAFIDAEHAMDPEYAAKLGVKIKELIVSQPDNGEEALNLLEGLVRSGMIDVVVVDSVAALTPKAEIEGEMGKQFMGLQARMMSQALRKLTAIAAKSGTLVIFINQLRDKIGVFFGSPETTPGGRALKFYTSVRIDVRRLAQIKKGDNIVGNRVKAKVVKNKVAPPFRIAEFDIMYGEGISYEADVLNAGLIHKAVAKAGASYSFGEVKLGVGFDNVRLKLKEDKKLLKEIEKKIKEMLV